MGAAQLANQREQRQVHRNNDAADDDSQEHDHRGFEGGQQVLDCRIDFFFVEIGYLLQHGVHGSGLLADADHLRHHARKHFRFLQRVGQVLASLHGPAHVHQRFFDDGVARCPAGDIQAFQDRHTRGDQRTQSASETSHSNFSQQYAYEWQFQQRCVYRVPSDRRSVPNLQADGNSSKGYHNQQTEDAANEVAHRDDDARGQRQIYAQAQKQSREDRDDLPQEQSDHAGRDEQHGNRIHQRGS